MKYSHELVGKAAKDVYTAFNEENNIDINPKLPDFPKARFDQIISAAGEEGKPRETILRRISVVPETVITSMSDNNTRACARAYSSAGFEAYITRSAAKGCCEWCSKMFGKFEYPKNTPKDIFRRHDNCECIVTYSCGSMRQNVHSKETWEQPDVTVPELTRNPSVTVPELTKNPLTYLQERGILDSKPSLVVSMQFFAKGHKEYHFPDTLEGKREKAKVFSEIMTWYHHRYENQPIFTFELSTEDGYIRYKVLNKGSPNDCIILSRRKSKK